MTKDELWRMVQEAKELQAKAREAWKFFATSLNPGSKTFDEVVKIDTEALRAREAVIQAVAQEMMG